MKKFKNFMKRKLWGIPISVIALLLVTVVTVAAFLLTLVGDISTTGMSVSGSFAIHPGGCTVTGEGTLSTCSITGSALTVVGADFDDETILSIPIIITPDAGGGSTISFSHDGLIEGISDVTCKMEDAVSDCNGYWIDGTLGGELMSLKIYYANLVPDQVSDNWGLLFSVVQD